MRFLLDQDVYAVTVRFLRDHGHDVLTAADIGASRALDETLLTTAHAQARLLMTRDRELWGAGLRARLCGRRDLLRFGTGSVKVALATVRT